MQKMQEGSIPVYNHMEYEIHQYIHVQEQTFTVTTKLYGHKDGKFGEVYARYTWNFNRIEYPSIPGMSDVLHELVRQAILSCILHSHALYYEKGEDTFLVESEKNPIHLHRYLYNITLDRRLFNEYVGRYEDIPCLLEDMDIINLLEEWEIL